MSTKAAGQDLVVEHLRELARLAESSGQEHLPTLRKLASETGVAYVTASKAVRRLVREGALRTVQGKGVFVAKTEVSGANGETAGSMGGVREARSWGRVCEQVRREVLRGVHAPGETLAPAKQLARTYGVTHRTLRKALAALERDGLLVSHGRGYRVAESGSAVGHGTVVLVARGALDPARLSRRGQEFIHSMQSECARASIVLRIVFYEYSRAGTLQPVARDEHLLDLPGGSSVVGYVVFQRAFTEPELRAVLARVGRHGLPLALLDETGELRMQPGSPGLHGARVFSISNSPLSGEITGRYLLGLGHHRVAYLCPHHATWSRNRLAGLRRVYADAGTVDGVVACVRERVEVADRTPAALAMVSSGTAELARRVSQEAGEWGGLVSRTLLRLAGRMGEETGAEITQTGVAPLVSEALGQDHVTAWVGSNDMVALSCLDHLARRGIRVPSDLTVVGFDDTLDAFLAKLTSYNHNAQAVMRAMLAHILNPRLTPRPARPGLPVEVEGFVNVRDTSARRSRSGPSSV